MDKRLSLIDLLSFIETLCKPTIIQDNNDNQTNDEQDVDAEEVNSTQHEADFSINSSKNHLSDSHFNILKHGEDKSFSDLPKKLKSIFEPFIPDIKRTGVLKSIDDLSKFKKSSSNINLSLISSILYCFKQDYSELENEDKITCVKKITDKFLIDIRSEKLFTKYKYKDIGWKKKELVDALKEYKNNLMVLRFLSEYFSVNIFLLNVSEDKIFAMYSEDNFNIFKSSIFLTLFEEVFEPISYKDKYIWDYDSEPLKKLINVDKLYIGIQNVNFSIKNKEDKTFQTGTDDLDKYLPEEEKQDKGEEDVVTKEDNNFDEVFPTTTVTEQFVDNHSDLNEIDCTETEIDTSEVTQDIFCTKHNTSLDELSLKMKLSEIQKIAKEYKISILSKDKTKNGKSILRTKADLYKELIKLA